VLPSPIVIHVLRPYASEEEYLAAERFSISPKSMLLIDQPPLPAETPIVFDVSLSNGQKPIRAEGIVVGYAEATGGQPCGVRVRFKRYGAATKAFIDRASAPPAASLHPQADSSTAQLAPAFPPAPAAQAVRNDTEHENNHASDHAREAVESSGVHRKAVRPVEPPLNREALLSRLRARHVG
jgi:hypothetical protein